MPRTRQENVIESVAHRLAARLIPGIKAQRKFLTSPNPVGYRKLSPSEINDMWNDPTGEGKNLLQQSLGPEEFARLSQRMAAKEQVYTEPEDQFII